MGLGRWMRDGWFDTGLRKTPARLTTNGVGDLRDADVGGWGWFDTVRHRLRVGPPRPGSPRTGEVVDGLGD